MQKMINNLLTHPSGNLKFLFTYLVFSFFYLLIIPCCFVNSVSAQTGMTYFVATNGNDSNNGISISLPWRTIEKATTVMQAGDTVLIRGGTYKEMVRLDLGKSGTAGNYITYKNYPGETPVLDGTGIGTWQRGIVSGLYDGLSENKVVNYIMIDGLEIKNYPSMGIAFERSTGNQTGAFGSHHITVQNCNIHDNGWYAIYFEGGDQSTGQESHDILVTHNTTYGNGIHNIKFQGDSAGTINRLQIRNSEISYNTSYNATGLVTGYGGAGQGIHCSTGCHDNLISHNTTYSNAKYGISLYEAWNNTVEYNETYDNGKLITTCGGIVLWTGSNNTVRYNKVYANAAHGIEVSSQLAGAATGNKIYNNLIYQNGTANAYYAGIEMHSVSVSNAVYNNTLVNNHNYQIWISSSVSSGQNIKNNIIYSAGTGFPDDRLIYIQNSGSGWGSNQINNNLYFSTDLISPWFWGSTNNTFAIWKSASKQDTNSVNADPLFVSSTDFRLQSASPAINVGAELSAFFQDDFVGTTRPQGAGFDIGAYEFVSSVTLSPSPTPTHCLPLGDIDCSGGVNAIDMSKLLLVFGGNNPPNTAQDLDNSGKINALDLAILIANFGK